MLLVEDQQGDECNNDQDGEDPVIATFCLPALFVCAGACRNRICFDVNASDYSAVYAICPFFRDIPSAGIFDDFFNQTHLYMRRTSGWRGTRHLMAETASRSSLHAFGSPKPLHRP
jgi:hypothetical protein